MSVGWRRWLAVQASVLGVVAGSVAVAAGPAEARPQQSSVILETAEQELLPDVPLIVSGDPLANSGPLSPVAAPSTVDAAPTPLDDAFVAAKRSGERVEVPSLRSETTTVFASPRGTLIEEVSLGPVRVARGDGWVPVDPTLVETAGGVVPRAVSGEVVLSAGGTGPVVEVAAGAPGSGEGNRGRVSVGVGEEMPVPVLYGSTATYVGAVGGADVVVEASRVGAEVSVVIPDRQAARTTYEFELEVEGASLMPGPAGTVLVVDESGNESGYVSAPVMFDAQQSPMPGVAAHPGELATELVERDGRFVLVVTPDSAFLDDPATVWPVTIDPATDLTPPGDMSVLENAPNGNFGSATTLYAGYNGFLGRMRALVKFNPTTVIEDQMVLGASLKVFQNWGGCSPTPLRVQQTATLTTGTTWNTQPALVGPIIATVDTAGDATSCPTQQGWKNLDVTALAQTWAGDPATSGSLALLADETDPAGAKGFSSKEGTHPPQLSVEYLIYPDTPTELAPDVDATVTTLRPELAGKITVPGYSGGVFAKFEVRDDTGASVATHQVVVNSGDRPSWTVPAKKLRPAHTYTWTMQACTGFFPQACSAKTSRSFTVNPALATGHRGFFTFDTVGISDTSGLSVNVASGNVSVTTSDMSMAGVNTPLALTRSYNSLGTEDLSFGHRWSGSYSDTVRLVDEPDGSKVFYGETGEAVRIAKTPPSTYTPSGDLDARFVDAGGYGVYILEFNHARGGHAAGDRLYFYNAGPLKNRFWGLRNRNGQQIVANYTGTTLTSLTDTQGRSIAYATAGSSPTKVTSRSYVAHSVTTTYDTNGGLTTVTDREGHVTTYEYDGDHRIIKITSPGTGRVIDIVYDGRGRATSVKRTVSTEVEESTYTYTDVAVGNRFKTVVTDARGNPTTYWADHAYRVESARNTLGDEVATTYDDNSNVINITAGTQAFTYDYSTDNRNNLEKVTSDEGVESKATYDQAAMTGLTPYQPQDATDPQGNMSQFTFDSVGNLQQSQNDLITENTSKVERQGINSTGCGGKYGQVCKTFDARNKATSFSYDGSGYLTFGGTARTVGC